MKRRDLIKTAGPEIRGPGESIASVRSSGGGQMPGAQPVRTATGSPSSVMHHDGPHQRSPTRIVPSATRWM